MRRLLSILLLAAFTLPLVAPLLALGQDPDAALPACCRRHGQHHCMMLDERKDPSAHQLVAVCPAWPQRAVPAFVLSHHLVGPVSTASVFFQGSSFSATCLNFHRFPSSERLHPKRGPPAAASPAIA